MNMDTRMDTSVDTSVGAVANLLHESVDVGALLQSPFFLNVRYAADLLGVLAERVVSEQGYVEDCVACEAQRASKMADTLNLQIETMDVAVQAQIKAAKDMQIPKPLVVGQCYRVTSAYPPFPDSSWISPDDHDIVKVIHADPRFPDSAVVRVAYRTASEAVCEVMRSSLEDDFVTQERIEAEIAEQEALICKLRADIEIAKDRKMSLQDSTIRLGRIAHS